MVQRNYFFIIFLLIVTVILTWGLFFYVYPQQDAINIENFPLKIDHWSGQDLPIDKAELTILETKNVIFRRYTNDKGRCVYLYIVYSQSNPKASNPPEVFYEGSNFSVIDKGKKYITIASSDLSFKINWLLLDNNQNQQMVYYWFKVGEIYTHSYWKDQTLVALNNIIRRNAGNALIRIATDIDNGHQQEAIDLINEFACLLVPQLYQHLP